MDGAAALAMVLWGVWGLFQKLATNEMSPRNVYFASALGAVSVVLALLATTKFPIPMNYEGAFFGIFCRRLQFARRPVLLTGHK